MTDTPDTPFDARASEPGAWQWRRDGVDIPGATGPEYTLTEEDDGAEIERWAVNPDAPFDAEAWATAFAAGMHECKTDVEILQAAYDAGRAYIPPPIEGSFYVGKDLRVSRVTVLDSQGHRSFVPAQPSTLPDACLIDGKAVQGSAEAIFDDICKRADEPDPNTIPVRIAVAAKSADEWHACGGHDRVQEDVDEARAWIDEDEGEAHISYVTARVPLPTKPTEIEGTVSGE